MTPEEAYQIYGSSLIEKDDFIQECWLATLENPNEKHEVLFKDIAKKMKKDVYIKAPHIYNDKGECVDDNVYFIDKSTVEQFGEGRRVNITEEQEECVKKLQQTIELIDSINNRVYVNRKSIMKGVIKWIIK